MALLNIPARKMTGHGRSAISVACRRNNRLPKITAGTRWFASAPAPESKYLAEQFSLEGKCAIITGGGTGIGAAIAEGLARAGASVVLVGRRAAPLEQAVDQIRQQITQDGLSGDPEARVISLSCDITALDTLPDLVQESHYLTNVAPTILVNNAGINVRQPADALNSDHWYMTLNLMLTAPFCLTRCLAPYMREQNYGRIINIASLQSFQAFPDSIPYAAAKSGVLGLTRGIAEAYSEVGCTANAIAPGYVETELTASVFADKERAQRLADATLLRRNSVPQDLVGAAVFLASPAASYITGQSIPVDGGFTALGMR